MSRAAPALRPRAEGRRVRDPALEIRSWGLLAAIVVLSRLLVFEEGALAFLYLPHAWVQDVPGYLPPPGGFWFQTLLGPWAHWDGYWYLSIAHLGYAGRPLATAFFPLYPLLLRALGGTVLAGVLASTVAFVVALGIIHRLAAEVLSPRAAWFTVLALAFFPTSFYFNAVYPESLFLLLAAGTYLAARRGRLGLAAGLAGLASATSIYGLFLAVPLAAALWRRRAPAPLWLWLALVPAGLLGYMATLFEAFGNPIIFQSVQSNWGRAFAPLWVTVREAVTQAVANVPAVVSFPRLFATGQPTDTASNVWNLLFAAVAVWLLVLAIRRLPWEYWLFSLLVVAVPFSYPSAAVPLMSVPRLLLAAWPLFLALGDRLAGSPTALKAYLWLSGAAGLVLVALFTTAHWVA
ncbi:MAG: hypothetical protein K6V97_03005 [Actinomycetia bacterium]|nr:hypothetical protein [Actinomycetes bacterium]